MTNLNNISVILCRPQLWLNVGACARVMSNMDYNDLRIVAPRDENIISKAYESASHADNILDNAITYSSLEEAVADLDFVVMTSARPRDMEKKVCNLDKVTDITKKYNKIGIVFGPERTGLTNQEIVLADLIIQIKTGQSNQSYNLSHAVAIVLYEFFNNQSATENYDKKNTANKQEIIKFLNLLENTLDNTGYFKEPQKKNGQILNIKNIFTRDYFTKQDIKTLYGILNHFKK